MSKVAVASNDGANINEHFGRAKEFLVYEVEDQGGYSFLERREVPPAADDSHDGQVAGVAQLLADVEVVLVEQIGPGAERQLRSRGVVALDVSGPIDKALKAYAQRGKFVRSGGVKPPSSGCHPGGGGCCSGGCK
ncbi:MAG TPA: NifB/NifX family molybdenum-iron cluster-binding protein [Patescibacteria group bacterium]|nr:NifB/NifX family molybdenum-iron cluster-binding protein [Patescibacteria group bacterium]